MTEQGDRHIERLYGATGTAVNVVSEAVLMAGSHNGHDTKNFAASCALALGTGMINVAAARNEDLNNLNRHFFRGVVVPSSMVGLGWLTSIGADSRVSAAAGIALTGAVIFEPVKRKLHERRQRRSQNGN